MWKAKYKIFLLTLGFVLSFISLICPITHSSDLRASFDGGSEVTDLMNQSLLIEFDNIKNISNNTEDSVYGQVRSSDDNIYVVWQESVPGNTDRNYEIFFKKSSDEGNSFGEIIRLSDNIGFSEHPQMASENKNVYVVWADNTNVNKQIYFKKSNDGGNSFDNNVYVAWNVEDRLDTKSGVYFISSLDNGMTFGNTSKLNTEEKDFGEPQVASYGNQVYVIWGGSDTNRLRNLSLIKSDDYGQTFSEINKISETVYGKLSEPSNVEIMADQNNRVFIACQDKMNPSDKDEIFFASSTDRGESFSGVTNLSNNADISECPSIIAVKDMVFATWEDLTPGNHEVLFARGTIL